VNFLCKVVALILIGWVLIQVAPLVLLIATVM